MINQTKTKVLPVKNGFWRCPFCRKKLIRWDKETKAKTLPKFCNNCRREYTLNIEAGLCWITNEEDVQRQEITK